MATILRRRDGTGTSLRLTPSAVLRAGVDAREYATHLLDVARASKRYREEWWPAPAIVRSSTLERRITAMLNITANRAPVTRLARFVTCAAFLGLAAAITSAQGALATFSGSVLDPMNRTLPNAPLELTNVHTKAKHTVRSDGSGRFEFAELPRGEYLLEVKYAGFRAFQGRVTLTGQNVLQNLNLEIGMLQETITVSPGPAVPPDPERQRFIEQKRRERQSAAITCGSTSSGGNIRPPMKMNDVMPQYPVHLGNAHVSGTVVMQAFLAKDGTVTRVRVVTPAHPDLDAAAVSAIQQWQFDSTLLNCMPVEVPMTVTVNFKAS